MSGAPSLSLIQSQERSCKSEEKEWKNTHKIIKRSGKLLPVECQFPTKFPNSRTLKLSKNIFQHIMLAYNYLPWVKWRFKVLNQLL